MTILDQNEQYTLNLEYMKTQGHWWLELIDRASGQVKILTSKRKDMFDGVTLAHAIRWTERLEWAPMYKKGII